MNRRVTAFIANHLLRPPAIVIGFVLRGGYWVLYGWWGEKRYLAKQQEKLAQEVLDRFSFLFAERGGRFVPNENLGHLAALQCPIVTVACDSLLLRFVRWRDVNQVHIASERLINEWHELAAVLSAVRPEDFSRHSLHSFEDAGRVLKDNFNLVKDAFSPERYTYISQQIEHEHRYDLATNRRVEAEINRRLYPDK